MPTALLACSEVGRPNAGLTIDVGHTLAAGGNMARDLDMALRGDRLFNVHTNDNYGTWDDDMIVGSVAPDRVPGDVLRRWPGAATTAGSRSTSSPTGRTSSRPCGESVLYMEKYAALVEKIGVDRLTG